MLQNANFPVLRPDPVGRGGGLLIPPKTATHLELQPPKHDALFALPQLNSLNLPMTSMLRISIADLVIGPATQTFGPDGKQPCAATVCMVRIM